MFLDQPSTTPSPQVNESSDSNPYSMFLNNSQTEDPISLIQKYFPPSEWSNAEKVMQAESGGKSNDVGDNYPINGQTIPSYGLFQIRALPGRPDPSKLVDPDFNVQYAANMWKSQGWEPWTTARKMGLPGTTPL